MPVDYTIDVDQGVVFTTLSGSVTYSEFSKLLQSLAKNPCFRPDSRELLVCNDAVTDEFDTNQIMSFKDSHVWGEGAKRAFVANSDLVYGLFRMFQIISGTQHGEIALFRDVSQARLWLGLS